MNYSRQIISNQNAVHERLEDVVRRHLASRWQAPIADHNRAAFELADKHAARAGQPLILDAGCGTGDSSRALARQFPDHLVIGVDKSAHRLAKERAVPDPDNLLLLRADLTDFYRLAHEAGWRLARHYLLYPNPWPKAAHLLRRWHGSPVFPDLLALGGRLELRTNWQLYAEEFAAALRVAGRTAEIRKLAPAGEYITLFEKKYAKSGQDLWQLSADLALVDPGIMKV